MPTYEYRCPTGHEFELIQKMSDEPRAACPECGETAERLLSGGAGLIFKGDGFYITDYRSEEYKKAASSDKEAAASETKGSGVDTQAVPGGGAATSGPSGEGAGTSGSEKGSSKSKGGSSGGSGASGGSKPSDSGKSSSSDA